MGYDTCRSLRGRGKRFRPARPVMVVGVEPVVVEADSAVERIYREHGQRLWRSLAAFTGAPDVASDAVAEAFGQALRRGEELRDPLAWIWRVAFRIASGELEGLVRNEGDRHRVGVDHRPPLLVDLLRSERPQEQTWSSDLHGAGVTSGGHGFVGAAAAGGSSMEARRATRGVSGTTMRPRVGRSRSKVTRSSRVMRIAPRSSAGTPRPRIDR